MRATKLAEKMEARSEDDEQRKGRSQQARQCCLEGQGLMHLFELYLFWTVPFRYVSKPCTDQSLTECIGSL